MATTATEGEEVIPVDKQHGIRAAIPDGYYTRKMAADLIGRSYDTIKRWEDNGFVKPSGYVRMGMLDVPVYSRTGIETLRKVAKSQKPGRPKNNKKGRR
jgi:hypothetical protein